MFIAAGGAVSVLQKAFLLTGLTLCDAKLKPVPADHRYGTNESVVVRAEARNVPNARSWFDRSYHLEERVAITDASGAVVDGETYPYKAISDGPHDPFAFCFMRPLSRLKPGRYTISVELADVPSGKTASGAVPIVVEAR